MVKHKKGKCASTLNIRFSRRRQKLYRGKIIFLFLYICSPSWDITLWNLFLTGILDTHKALSQIKLMTLSDREIPLDNWGKLDLESWKHFFSESAMADNERTPLLGSPPLPRRSAREAEDPVRTRNMQLFGVPALLSILNSLFIVSAKRRF